MATVKVARAMKLGMACGAVAMAWTVADWARVKGAV
jgi:hypothetical protein